jgi:glycoside/pentoside/hexuronide:cation symporter, GPH family
VTVARWHRLPAYGLFAALLSAAGLPLYIHAPKFYVDEYGVSLAALGTALFGLRLLDVVQDPLLGRWSEALRHRRGAAVTVAAAVMAVAMLGLFAVPPMAPPLLWFSVMLALVFSGFSFLTISFYAQGVTKARGLPGDGHLSVARWRETGALLGVCAAAVAPAGFGVWSGAPFTGFAVAFAILAIAAVWSMRQEWRDEGVPAATGFGVVLGDARARRLLLIALVNAAPVAVTSTLFLFYVESALQAPGWEGPLLLLFFLSAAFAAPLWGTLAQRFGPRRVLMSAMVLSVASFAMVLLLGPGQVALFALVCLGSGAAVGADLTLLPAMFARRMDRIAPSAALGFGLWSFVSKFTLALAAIALLPVLDHAGLGRGADPNPSAAVKTLVWLYAGLPCILKVSALVLLAGIEDEGDNL